MMKTSQPFNRSYECPYTNIPTFRSSSSISFEFWYWYLGTVPSSYRASLTELQLNHYLVPGRTWSHINRIRISNESDAPVISEPGKRVAVIVLKLNVLAFFIQNQIVYSFKMAATCLYTCCTPVG